MPKASFKRTYMIPMAIVLIIVASAWAFYPVARLHYCEQREASRLEVELAGLQERNADLRSQVDRLKTPAGVEEIARESLGMVKEGEDLVVVVDANGAGVEPVLDPQTACIPQGESSTWQELLDMLFGLE